MIKNLLEWLWWIRALWQEIDREEEFVDLNNPRTRYLLAKATHRWRGDARSSIVHHAKVVRDLKAIQEREERARKMGPYIPRSSNIRVFQKG